MEEPAQPVVQETVQPVLQETVLADLEETAPAAVEEAFHRTAEEMHAPEAAGETPPEVNVFSMEIPAPSAIADEIPYVEPWLEVAPSVAKPVWQASGQSFALPLGSLVSIAGPPAGEIGIPALAAETVPLEFAPATVNLSALSDRACASAAPAYMSTESESDHALSALPAAQLVPLEICSAAPGAALSLLGLPAAPAEFPATQARLHVPFAASAQPARGFPAASPIPLHIRVTASGAGHQTSSNGALRFPVRSPFQDSSFLNLYPSGIDFPAEDSDVVLATPWAGEMLTPSNGHHLADENGLAGMENSGSPRQVLEALSKLQHGLADPPAASEPLAEPQAVDLELVAEPSVQNAIAAGPEAPSAPIIDIAVEPADQPPVPRSAHDLLEIPWKTFAPPKPYLDVESNALIDLAPEMPRLKALPLRPKVAKAPSGFSPQTSAAQAGSPVQTGSPVQANVAVPEPKSKAPGPTAPPRPEVRASQISLPPAKQPAQPVKSPPTVQTVKPGQSSKPAQAVKPAQPAKPTQPAKPQTPVGAVKAQGTGPQPPPRQAAPAQPLASATKGPTQPLSSPATMEQAGRPAEEILPSFASIQTGQNGSFVGSLKGKLTIAILLVVIAGGVFYGLSSPSHAPASAPVSAAEDGVGPSIMLGEGGWVQGWGGDPNGSTAGRQITIYRPSLKLSDYRIEFQGEIDSKSIGWVFRAMDPYNYYAMKLAIVTPGLSPKLALIRYAVVQGHEREMGRIPLDLAARNDTLFSVRMDVRGSKFSTYLQGQRVDVWTDEQIKSGGVGFFNDRAERARIKSAAISYLTGGKN